MKNIIGCLLLMGAVMTASAAEEQKPYNLNDFSYEAVSRELHLVGNGSTTQLHHARHIVAGRLNQLVRDGKIKDGTEFEVRIRWKDKDFRLTITAHNPCPPKNELPRGPDKDKELPRGPNKEKEMPRGIPKRD